MAEPDAPDLLTRGIATLYDLMGGDGLLMSVPPRPGEVASLDYALPQDFLGQDRTLHIGFPASFPKAGLRLRITPPAWLEWPHVMTSGVCLFAAGDRPVNGTPEDVVGSAIVQIERLVRNVLPITPQAARDEQFHQEIRTYWAHQLDTNSFQLILADTPEAAQPLLALTDPAPVEGSLRVFLAADVERLSEMAARINGGVDRIKSLAPAGLYIPLEHLPPLRLPAPEPMQDWILDGSAASDQEAVRTWLATTGNFPLRFVVLRLPQADSPGFFALTLRSRGIAATAQPRYGRRAGGRYTPGTSPGTIAHVERAPIQVLARTVVHSRALNLQARLQDAHVVLVGVGSLGSTLATHMARSGVQRLTLIDPEVLEAANLGRHALGLPHLGRSKAVALARQLTRDVPTVEASAIPSFVEEGSKAILEALDSASLVLVSTADWLSELCLWECKAQGASWPLVQVWSEPHALVGHALVSPNGSPDDARSLFENHGQFRHRLSDWPDDGVIRPHACGVSYIPGGAVALAAVASLGAQAALDTLTGAVTTPRWYSHVSQAATIEAAGGTYRGPPTAEGVASQVLIRPWPAAPVDHS